MDKGSLVPCLNAGAITQAGIPVAPTKATETGGFFYDMHYVYVIYSESTDRFYIGETENIEIRLKWHNEAEFKGSYTSIAQDWKIYLLFELENISVARKMEMYMKSQKSRKFIIGLKESEKKRNKLSNKFSGGHCPDILERED